jgi:hypothetical protein
MKPQISQIAQIKNINADYADCAENYRLKIREKSVQNNLPNLSQKLKLRGGHGGLAGRKKEFC